MPRRSVSPTTLLAAAVLVLIVTSLAPTRLTAWAGWPRGPLMALIAPVSGPLAAVSSWVRPPAEAGTTEERVTVQQLLQDRERLATDLLRSEQRNRELEDLVRELQGGAGVTGRSPVIRLEASRVGANLPGGTIDVARGRRDGVIGGTVAIARRSEQLVGIVTAAGRMTSTVHLLTDEHLEPALVEGVVLPGGDPGSADAIELDGLPRVQLEPAGDGTLVAEAVGVDDADRMAVGQRVRLDDPSWPTAASMLVIGRVTALEPTEDPLFRRVVVTPEVEPGRLRSVILLIPRVGEGETGGGR